MNPARRNNKSKQIHECSFSLSTCVLTFPMSSFSLYWLSWTTSCRETKPLVIKGSQHQYHLLITSLAPHVGICDGHTFGFNGGLPGDAAPPLLQRHLPVRQPSSLGAGGPRGTGSVAIRRGHAGGSHVHGSDHVGQLSVVLGVRLWPAGGVTTHGGGVRFPHS